MQSRKHSNSYTFWSTNSLNLQNYGRKMVEHTTDLFFRKRIFFQKVSHSFIHSFTHTHTHTHTKIQPIYLKVHFRALSFKKWRIWNKSKEINKNTPDSLFVQFQNTTEKKLKCFPKIILTMHNNTMHFWMTKEVQ